MSEVTRKHKAKAPKKLNFAIIVCSSVLLATSSSKQGSDLMTPLAISSYKRCAEAGIM